MEEAGIGTGQRDLKRESLIEKLKQIVLDGDWPNLKEVYQELDREIRRSLRRKFDPQRTFLFEAYTQQYLEHVDSGESHKVDGIFYCWVCLFRTSHG